MPRKERSPADTLTLAQWDPLWTSDLQTRKVMFLMFEAVKFVVIR